MYRQTFQRAAGERISVAGQQAGEIARKLGSVWGWANTDILRARARRQSKRSVTAGEAGETC